MIRPIFSLCSTRNTTSEIHSPSFLLFLPLKSQNYPPSQVSNLLTILEIESFLKAFEDLFNPPCLDKTIQVERELYSRKGHYKLQLRFCAEKCKKFPLCLHGVWMEQSNRLYVVEKAIHTKRDDIFGISWRAMMMLRVIQYKKDCLTSR